MRLTRFTDYSIRVLIYLGLQGDDHLISIKEIADTYHISNNHLVKIVHELGKLGLVETIRGRGGGIRLAMNPGDINLGWVVRQTEEDFDVVECFNSQSNTCILSGACKLKGVLRRAVEAYLSVLDGCTLADIISNKEELIPVFNEEGYYGTI
jgi:Rrf2 family nitric oxide-sensitive transcriptional repressor